MSEWERDAHAKGPGDDRVSKPEPSSPYGNGANSSDPVLGRDTTPLSGPGGSTGPDPDMALDIDDFIERFETAWNLAEQPGTPDPPPAIPDYLPPGAAETPLGIEVLEELILVDMERRTKRGETGLLPGYVGDFPQLCADPECLRRLSDQLESLLRRQGDGSSGGLSTNARRLGNNFEWEEEVGRGSFGTVYRARDIRLNRTVAIKIPRSEVLGSEADRTRFRREAQHAAQLTHPCIVPVYEVNFDGEIPFIVQEFIEGPTLDTVLEQHQFSPVETVMLLIDVARALDHAHQRGVIHRDLKPSNIMLEPPSVSSVGGVQSSSDRAAETWHSGSYGQSLRPRPRLTDFGLARHMDDEAGLTQDGVPLGTPMYMSPEQAMGDSHQADQRSDIFSLGVILYQMLTGEVPFRASKMEFILQKVATEEPKRPRKIAKHVPRDLETICLKCMEKSPQRRFESAGELVAELERFLAGAPLRIRPVSRPARVARWCHRRPALTAMITLLLLSTVVAVGASAGWFIDNRRDLAEEKAARITVGRLEEAATDLRRSLKFRLPLLEEVESFLDLCERFRLTEPPPSNSDDWPVVDVMEAEFRTLYAEMLLNGSRPEAAREQARKATGLFEQWPTRLTSDQQHYLFSALWVESKSELMLGNLDAASTRLDELIKRLQPHEDESTMARMLAHANAAMARARAQDGKTQRALAHAEEAVRGMLGLDSEGTEDRRDLADMYFLMAALLKWSQPEEALEENEKATQLYRELVAARPLQPEFRLELCRTLIAQADLHRRLDDSDPAITSLESALALLDEAGIDETVSRLAKADIHTLMGFVRLDRQELEEAKVAFDQAAQAHAGLKHHVDRPAFQLSTALRRHGLGRLASLRGNTREAREHLEVAEATLIALAEQLDKNEVDYRRQLALVHMDLAQVYSREYKVAADAENQEQILADQIQQVQAAIKEWDEVLRNRPDDPEGHFLHYKTCLSLALAVAADQRPVDARQHARRAIALLETLVDASGTAPELQIEMGRTYGRLALELFDGDDRRRYLGRSVEVFRTVASRPDATVTELRLVISELVALAEGPVTGDADLSEIEVTELKTLCYLAASDLMRQMVEKQPDQPGNVATLIDFLERLGDEQEAGLEPEGAVQSFEEALLHCDRLIEFDPSNPVTQHRTLYLHLRTARLHLELDRSNECEAICRQALSWVEDGTLSHAVESEAVIQELRDLHLQALARIDQPSLEQGD